jgi:hypothetical protein
MPIVDIVIDLHFISRNMSNDRGAKKPWQEEAA